MTSHCVAIWGLIPCLAFGCAADVPATRPAPPPPKPVEPWSNVPLRGFQIFGTTLIAGESTQLEAVLARRVRKEDGVQTLLVTSKYYPLEGSGSENDVWEIPPDGRYTLKEFELVRPIDVKVRDQFAGRGLMKIEACTLDAGKCPPGKSILAEVLINP